MAIKIAFFDVDGTLSVPVYDRNGEKVIGFPMEEWGRYCAENGEDTYRFCKPVMPVKRYACELKHAGVLLYVLTTSQSDPETRAKEKFIEKNYPGMFRKVISVGTDREKLTAIRETAGREGLRMDECELVEDTFSTLLYVMEAGVRPTHIASLVWNL